MSENTALYISTYVELDPVIKISHEMLVQLTFAINERLSFGSFEVEALSNRLYFKASLILLGSFTRYYEHLLEYFPLMEKAVCRFLVIAQFLERGKCDERTIARAALLLTT